MKLTVRTEYALLALIYLARQEPDTFVHGKEIAESCRIPMRFLQQILLLLKNGRIVRSGKGKSGGYALARPPKMITIAEVVRLFDGPLAPTTSVSKNFYESTPIEQEPKMVVLFGAIRDLVAKKLERTTLRDLL